MDSITVDIGKLPWRPSQDEQILVAHEKCQILIDNGASIASTQIFTCCVTDKGLVIIPEGNYKVEKFILGLGLSAMDVGGFWKKVTLQKIYKDYINSPIYVYRADIKSAKIDLYTAMNGMFGRHYAEIVINDETLFLGVKDVGYAMDIVTSIYQPELFTE